MSIVDELVTLLGIEVDPAAQTTAYKFGFILGEVGKAAFAMGAALSTAAGAITAYAMHTADAIDKEQELAATLGVSYEAYQKLAYAAKLSGGDTQTLNADLERLQETLLNPATGVQNKALSALGISARNAAGELKSADVIVNELAGKFENLTAAEQNSYAKLLRISPATVRLLQNGQKGLADMGAEAESLGIILDQRAATAAADFGDSLDRVKATTQGVGRAVAVGLLPGLQKVVDGVTEWVKANRRLIASGITQIVEGVGRGFRIVGDAVSVVWESVKRFLPALEDLTEDLDATQAIAIAVALAIGAAGIAAAVAAAPFIAIGAAIAAVVLIIEDLYAAMNGGESIIGGWVGQFKAAFPEVAEIIEGVIHVLKFLVSFVNTTMIDSFNELLHVVKVVFGGIATLVTGALEGLEKTISTVKKLGDPASFRQMLGMRPESPVPAGVQAGAAAGAGGNTIAPTIIINGSGDPAAVGQEVVRRSGLGQTLQQSQPGARGPVVG